MKINKPLLIAMLLCFLAITHLTTAQDGGPNEHTLERVFQLDAPYTLQQNQLDSLIT